MPLRVVLLYTTAYLPPRAGGLVQSDTGCVGDGSTRNPNLVIDIRGDGTTVTPRAGLGRVDERASGGCPTWRLMLVPTAASRGPDRSAPGRLFQVLGGTNITFRNFHIGNYGSGLSTCQGAGGAFFYSLRSENVRVEGGTYIACNHALNAGAGSGHVSGAKLRPPRRRHRPRLRPVLLLRPVHPAREHHDLRPHVSAVEPPAEALGTITSDRMSIGERVLARTRAWAKESETVRRWRERRYQRFVSSSGSVNEEAILDVGAGSGAALERFNRRIRSSRSISPPRLRVAPHPNVVVQHGRRYPAAVRRPRVPLAFSNSVIEHVPQALQVAFAAEVARVSERYYVQTPNRWFPIEPHYQVPLFHFLPERALRALNRRFTMGSRAKGEWYETTLLSAADLLRLFPEAEIHREKRFGLTKSLMVIRGPGAARSPAREDSPS